MMGALLICLMSWPVAIVIHQRHWLHTHCGAWMRYGIIMLLGLLVVYNCIVNGVYDSPFNQRTYLVGLCVPFTQRYSCYSFLTLLNSDRQQTCFEEWGYTCIEEVSWLLTNILPFKKFLVNDCLSRIRSRRRQNVVKLVFSLWATGPGSIR